MQEAANEQYYPRWHISALPFLFLLSVWLSVYRALWVGLASDVVWAVFRTKVGLEVGGLREPVTN